ncbi:LuxR C-terminal-related transcriptional regulator [Pedobacter duraquae]|uniref:PAS domain-containing protein n=1 Tax=Pedobacter duraquae TaxID=425511 RepID=A0A4R6IDB2_9SPHI|nr:LuxR C-terminal-related transcriptional regulator [Pedobacter duraquae]TDO19992.1 PAS domain-containing protein [Pedobacter duraquae]
MPILKFDEAKKIWHKIARNTSDVTFSFELEIHKQLINIFHVGDFYYYIFNCATASMELVSDNLSKILGLDDGESFTIETLLTLIHPEDLPYFLKFEHKVTEFFNTLPPEKVLKYKVSYDYRIKHKSGHYVRILQQVVTIQSDDTGAVIRVLGVHTDISHLKKTNGSTLSFIGLQGEPSYKDLLTGETIPISGKSVFTKKEKEIMKLLMEGKTSNEIAELLFISKLTVDVHRKNMLRKTNSDSVVDLTVKCLQENWI